jgi:carbamoyl-phosphate synthase large subunit
MVTGAGSGVGQGIIKALRLSKRHLNLIAADITPLNSALFRADEALLMPKVETLASLNKTRLESKRWFLILKQFQLLTISG